MLLKIAELPRRHLLKIYINKLDLTLVPCTQQNFLPWEFQRFWNFMINGNSIYLFSTFPQKVGDHNVLHRRKRN